MPFYDVDDYHKRKPGASAFIVEPRVSSSCRVSLAGWHARIEKEPEAILLSFQPISDTPPDPKNENLQKDLHNAQNIKICANDGLPANKEVAEVYHIYVMYVWYQGTRVRFQFTLMVLIMQHYDLLLHIIMLMYKLSKSNTSFFAIICITADL